MPRESIIGAISRPDGEVIVPRGKDIIQAGDRVIVFALERTVSSLESVFLAGTGGFLQPITTRRHIPKMAHST